MSFGTFILVTLLTIVVLLGFSVLLRRYSVQNHLQAKKDKANEEEQAKNRLIAMRANINRKLSFDLYACNKVSDAFKQLTSIANVNIEAYVLFQYINAQKIPGGSYVIEVLPVETVDKLFREISNVDRIDFKYNR